MKFKKDTSGITRYIAFDIHKGYALVGGQDARQEWVMQPRRIGMEKLREWAIETTTNVWDVYDVVAPLVSYVVAAHAGGVRQIAEARVKTDKRFERIITYDNNIRFWIMTTGDQKGNIISYVASDAPISSLTSENFDYLVLYSFTKILVGKDEIITDEHLAKYANLSMRLIEGAANSPPLLSIFLLRRSLL